MSSLTRFGLYLINNWGFNVDTVRAATDIMESNGESSPSALARILVSEYSIDHDQVYLPLARHYAFSELSVDLDYLDASLIMKVRLLHDKIERQFLRKLIENDIVPFRTSGKGHSILQALAADPTNPLLRDIELNTAYKTVEVYWAPLFKLRGLIATLQNPPSEVKDLIEKANPQTIFDNKHVLEDVDDQAINQEINKGYLVYLYESTLEDAVRNDASDIHVIPNGKLAIDIYIRIDGRLTLWKHQENIPPEAMAAVIKDRSIGIDRFARDKAQDGYAQRSIDGHLIRFRVSILPMVSTEYERRFESIVIRVIDDRKVITDLSKLGFQANAEQELLKSIRNTKGIVIVTGPTGSGKSTTLMAALNHIISPSFNVLTCEDPVEYVIKGARQLKIGPNMSFDEAMRSILRHDPDIVMVGEIRDKITAEISIKLANTGHLTLTTLHTNDAPSAITRLYKMGIEPFLLAYSINIIVAQRLVRKLCEHCRKPIERDVYPTAINMGIPVEDIEQGQIYRAVGCPRCRDGYNGRINITEALYFYPDIRAELIRISTEIDEDRIRVIAQKHGMLSMRDSGIDRVKKGLTTIDEVLYATTED